MRKPIDILLGTKAAPKSEPTPIEQTRAKIYAPNPLVQAITKNETKKKFDAEAAYNAELKRRRTAVKEVPVKTKYGTATVPQKGYESYTLGQKTAWLKQTAKEIEDTVDAQQKADGGTVVPPKQSPYDPGKPVTEGDFYTAAANTALGTQPGMQTANTVAATDTGKAIADGARDVSKAITVKNDDPFAQFMLDLTLNAPAGVASNIGNIFDVNVDNLGKLQSVAELTATAIPAGTSVKAGKAAFDASRKGGMSFLKSAAKGVGAAAMENIGIGSRAASGLAEKVVSTGRRGIDALPIPSGIRERLIPRTNELPFTPKPALMERNPVAPGQVSPPDAIPPATVVDDFATQQRSMLRDVLGADDVDYEDFYGTASTTPKSSKIEPEPTQSLPDLQPVADVPVAKEPVPAPKIADMAPRSPEPVATPTTQPQRTTGLSNAANLTDVEQGILSSAPEGRGRSVKEIYETNRNRKDFDDVADQVSKGAPLTADNAAALLAGRGEYTAQVRTAKEVLDKAITDGATPSRIAELQGKLDEAIENATKYAEKVQRGKSEWSDIGRTLAAELDIDTRDIAAVLQEARLKKGAALTKEEIEKYTKLVDDLRKEVDASKAEIERLMKAHAENATKVAAARKIVRTPEARAAKRKQALDEFLTASSGLNAYVNPNVIKQFAKYMYTLIEDGARTVDDIVAAAAKDGIKADFEDVYAAMRSQVKESTLSDLQKEIAKTKRELRKEAESAIPGNQAVKDFRKAERADAPGNEAVKDFKATEASKKRLQDKLKGLEERIANKDYAEVSIVKNARKTDNELDLLRQKIRVKESIVKAGIESARPKTGADKVGNFLNEIKLLNPASRLKDFTANAVKGADFVATSILRRGVDWTTAKILGEDMITKGTTVDRTQRILDKSGNRLKADAELIVKGADPDSIKKYGSYKGIGGKAAGLSDVPFKSFYYEWMQDAAADYKARKALGKGASPESIATKREEILSNIDEHPDIQLMAEEYSLNQTFNNNNWASRLVGSIKRETSGAGKVAVDEFIGRFAKVITNVATDATDRTGIGIIRGGLKLRNAKALGNSLTVSERAIINDMITKGATGMATLALGYFLGDKIPGTIKGERGKYIDFGDLESVGGPISPLLLGAIYKKSESIEDPEQAAGLRLASVLRLPINTPLASNTKDLLGALTDSSSTQAAKKFLARKISNVFIPGGVRDIAERMDSDRGVLTGAEIEREKIPKEINPKTKKEVQTKNFLEILKGDVKSKIPFWRQTLPIKKTDADKKADKKKESEAKRSALLK